MNTLLVNLKDKTDRVFSPFPHIDPCNIYLNSALSHYLPV